MNPFPDGAAVLGGLILAAIAGRLIYRYLRANVKPDPPAPARKPVRAERRAAGPVHLGFCPRCGKDLVEKAPRDGKLILGCSGSTCGYARSVNA